MPLPGVRRLVAALVQSWRNRMLLKYFPPLLLLFIDGIVESAIDRRRVAPKT